ncbi:hypothetical protein T484DRAFT_1841273, partial [Baffinella frigidus]
TLLIDAGDIIGTILSIAGAALICFWPRASSPPPTLLIDTGDIIGTILSIAGAALICFWPRATSPPVETTPT